jgi:hypothetical protein
MGHRILIVAGALLALEAVSVAWAWPHVERWTESNRLQAMARVGERVAARALDRARDLAVRGVEQMSGDALERMAALLGPVGRETRVVAAPAVARVEALRGTPCATAKRAAAAVEWNQRRRVVTPETIF